MFRDPRSPQILKHLSCSGGLRFNFSSASFEALQKHTVTTSISFSNYIFILIMYANILSSFEAPTSLYVQLSRPSLNTFLMLGCVALYLRVTVCRLVTLCWCFALWCCFKLHFNVSLSTQFIIIYWYLLFYYVLLFFILECTVICYFSMYLVFLLDYIRCRVSL